MISRQGRNRKILFTGDYEGKILNKIYVFSIPVCPALYKITYRNDIFAPEKFSP